MINSDIFDALIPFFSLALLTATLWPIMRWLRFQQAKLSTAFCAAVGGELTCLFGFVLYRKYIFSDNTGDILSLLIGITIAILILFPIGIRLVTNSSYGKCLAASVGASISAFLLFIGITFVAVNVSEIL